MPGDKNALMSDMGGLAPTEGAVYGANVEKGIEEGNLKLATLVGSRVCHDLISPIGAVQNGVELLEMARTVDGPELELIADSVKSASTRARFFRIAYGGASAQMLGRAEVTGVIDDFNTTGRLNIDWQVDIPQPRALVRLAFLALQCCEAAMPLGGSVTVALEGDTWVLTAEGRRVQIDPTFWEDLMAHPDLDALTPAQVQFALVPLAAEGLGRKVVGETSEGGLSIRF